MGLGLASLVGTMTPVARLKFTVLPVSVKGVAARRVWPMPSSIKWRAELVESIVATSFCVWIVGSMLLVLESPERHVTRWVPDALPMIATYDPVPVLAGASPFEYSFTKVFPV